MPPSALNRQLVEVEYLSWAFAEDQSEAASWLRSSREERLQFWQPRHVRSRSAGRFRSTDYASHCDLGGHPTPEGARALIGAERNQDTIIEVLFLETATHGISAWDYLVCAVGELWPEGQISFLVSDSVISTIEAARTGWRVHDHLINIRRTIYY